MVSLSKMVGVMSCGFLLSLGLSNVVQAEHTPSPSDVMKTDKQVIGKAFNRMTTSRRT